MRCRNRLRLHQPILLQHAALCFLCLWTTFASCQSQTPQPPNATIPATSILGLNEAYRAALVEDAGLQAARAHYDSVTERLTQALAQLRPNITFSVSRFHNDLTRNQANVLPQATSTNELYFSHSQTLQLRQSLYRPALNVAVDQARFQIEEAAATLNQEVQNLGVRVVEAYAQILLTQEREALLEMQLRTTTQQLDAARKRFKAGQGIRTDADETQARLDLLLSQQLEARQSRETALLQLQTLVQRPVRQVKPLTLNPFDYLDFDTRSAFVWREKALSQNPEIEAKRSRVAAARLEVERVKALHRPTLDAIAQITRSGNENASNPQTSYTNRQIGFQFNLPLYSGGGTQSAVRQALAEQNREEALLEASRRDVEIRVQKEWRGVTEASARIAAQERIVTSADQVTHAVRRSFDGGIRTILDVLNAEQQAQMARRDLGESRLNYVVARLRLAALIGELNSAQFVNADEWFQSKGAAMLPTQMTSDVSGS